MINDTLKEALTRYVEHHIPTGGFLKAVLSNDLMEACNRADGENRHALFDIVSYCYNELPGGCWGSPETVNAWVRKDLTPRFIGAHQYPDRP